MKKALCFVTSKQFYEKQGKHALLSAAEHNPDYDIVIISDGVQEERAKYSLHYRDLGLEQTSWIITARCAVIQYTIKKLNYDYCFLIDGDTFTYAPYTEMERPFEAGEASVLVIPHILQPLPNDGRNPSMATIRLAGNYNAGIFGFSSLGIPFLDWFTEQTKNIPHMAQSSGYCCEQGWLQFAADFDEKTHIFRHPGYNVAYWNIMQRSLTREDGRWLVDGEKLVIMHFSGLKENIPTEKMSIYQDRYVLANDTLVYKLFEEYKQLIWSVK